MQNASISILGEDFDALSRRAEDGPVVLLDGDTPSLVLLSVDQFVRLKEAGGEAIAEELRPRPADDGRAAAKED